MKKTTFLKAAGTLSLVVGASVLLGCQHDKGPVSYEIDVINLTAHQPFSPPAIVLHDSGYQGWMLSHPASLGLEVLAEGGNPAEFINDANSNGAVKTTFAATAPIGPGMQGKYTVEADNMSDLKLTLATMLVNTNDAFTGATGHDISGMKVHDMMSFFVRAYDAGTEANTETAATIPGPAGGGEGVNDEREMHEQVRVHGGVLTKDEGLLDSALDQSHRFDNPVAKIMIHRTK